MDSYLTVRISGEIRRNYMEMIMNEEFEWRYNMERDAVDGDVDFVCGDEVVQALKTFKKSPWTFRCIIGVTFCLRRSRNSSDG